MMGLHERDVMRFPGLGDTRLSGCQAARFERFARERLTSDAAWETVYREAAEAFRTKQDDASGVIGLWQGEFWGKWVIGACRYALYSGDGSFRSRLQEEILRFLTLQEPDGYLGTYRDSGMVLPPSDLQAAKAIMGWECNWNWNIWCRKYTLWGLVEAVELFGDERMLSAAVRFADHLISELREKGIRIQDTGTFGGLPSCSIIKPMVRLSALTGNTAYAAFAETCAAAFDDPSGRAPNLIANARSGRPVHTWYPHPEKWAKAYEFLSVLDGFCELYRATGARVYLDTSIALHRLLREHERNILGSVGYNDMFANASAVPDAISEPCDHIHWMRLCTELYSLTGDVRYVDDFEACYLNAFQAGLFRDGRWGARGVRSQGRHFAVFTQAGMTRNHCCVNNLPRGVLNAAQLSASYGSRRLAVNLYSPFESTLRTPFGTYRIAVSDGFLPFGRFTVRVTPEAGASAVPVSLRVPGWTSRASVTCRGVTSCPAPGTMCDVQVASSGETVIEVSFELTVRVHETPRPFEALAPEDWRARRWMCASEAMSAPYGMLLKRRRSTVTAGPLLLARSADIGSPVSAMFGGAVSSGSVCSVTPVLPGPGEPDWRFEAVFRSGVGEERMAVCDYGTAGNRLSETPELFSVYF